MTTGLTEAELDALVARMRSIHRGSEAWGTGTPAEMATAFRRECLLPEVIRRARERFGDPPRCALLVSLSGFSPETTILAWEILRPPEVLVLSSEEARESYDVVHDHLRAAGVRPHQLRLEPIDPTNVRAVHDAVEKARRRVRGDGEVVVDITGGKKLMSAAGALAAFQQELRLAYVDSEYDPDLRAPWPGTERLVLLPSPAALFAHEREREAAALFDSGAYLEAHRRFSALADTLERPAEARLHRALAALYRAWTDLDLDALGRAAEEVEGPLAAAGLPGETARRLAEQVSWLGRLAARREPAELHLCFYLLGRHYRAQGRHDFAALFFYRTLEGLLGARLRARAPALHPQAPDYTLLSPDLEELRRRYAEALGATGGAVPDRLPSQLGYLSTAALLVALGEPRIDLGRLRDLARVRNESVLAHGTTPVSPKDAERLERCAREMLEAADPEVETRARRLAPLRLARP